ncbi:MAG: DUF1565 domain-containing protein [Lentimicrobium sp.]|nr:DUF1565 domain-containing protein [Lentimicrobium sp.]
MKKLLLLLTFGICFMPIAWAQIIYVDAANTTGNEDGSAQHPFNTIKEGINAASPGTQVMIKQGNYIPDDSWSGNDHTLLLKAGVSLLGESRENTIISGIVVDQEVSNLSIGLEKLKFDEFHFTRATHAGPFNERNFIRNCATTLISQGFGAGIPVNDTTHGPNFGFLIENNDLGNEGSIEFKQGAGVSEQSVLNNSCGYIYLKSGGGYTYLIDNNDVTYGIFDNSAFNKTTISNNRIYNGTISDRSGGNQYGIEDEIIENNTIAATESSPAFTDEDYKAGIIAKSRSVTIRNNTITCTGDVSGIRSSAGAPLHIINNTITLDEVPAPAPDPYEGTSGIFNYSGWGYVTGNKITGGNMGYYSKAGTVEFANNEIEKAYTGFYSMGAEVVHHNMIKNCYGDGMILDGLRGPIFNNSIKDNAGAGIRITRVPIDLGGGQDTCPGLNVITGNGNFDLYIETISEQHPMVFARFNVWDHSDPIDIMQYDIRDGSDSTGLVTVDFNPVGYLGVDEVKEVTSCEIFPNPTTGKFMIYPPLTFADSFTIELVDLAGRVTEMLSDIKSWHDQTGYDISHLPSGVYICRIADSNTVIMKKIVKCK